MDYREQEAQDNAQIFLELADSSHEELRDLYTNDRPRFNRFRDAVTAVQAAAELTQDSDLYNIAYQVGIRIRQQNFTTPERLAPAPNVEGNFRTPDTSHARLVHRLFGGY